MINDKLMINDEKTEFLLICTKAQLAKVKDCSLTIGKTLVTTSDKIVRNLGTWFDSEFNMNYHITKTFWALFYHLHNIRRVRKYLDKTPQKNWSMLWSQAGFTTATDFFTDCQAVPLSSFNVCRMLLHVFCSRRLAFATYLTVAWPPPATSEI